MNATIKEAIEMGFSMDAAKLLGKFGPQRKEKFNLDRLKYEAVMELLFEWRHAEVNASAIALGLRTGNLEAAKNVVAEKEKRLRCFVDSKLPLGGFKPRKIGGTP